MEKAMAPQSSTLAWKIPWKEEPGRLQSMGSLRVGYDWATSLSLSLSRIGEGNGNPLQCSCLENPRDGGAWWAAVYGVAQSRTRLKRLRSSSSSQFDMRMKQEHVCRLLDYHREHIHTNNGVFAFSNWFLCHSGHLTAAHLAAAHRVCVCVCVCVFVCVWCE